MSERRSFLRRHYLWPLFPHGWDFVRFKWLVWRWWFDPIRASRRRAQCAKTGHGDYYGTMYGLVRELEAGGGRQQTRCGRCGTVVWEAA